MLNSNRDETLDQYGAANDRHLCDRVAFSGFLHKLIAFLEGS